MASVTFDHVYKRFGDVTAVNDLNIEVEDKEFLVFVGPSGCGKTTSLRLLAGLEEISEGNIMIGDRVVNDVPPKDRDIAMVFQSYALYPHKTVAENIGFPLKVRRMDKSEIDEATLDAARQVQIEDLLQQTYYQGSPAVEEEVTQLALDYRLMSPYTSFVAVDSSQPATADPPTPPLRMPVRMASCCCRPCVTPVTAAKPLPS